jgi:hypothetical protein
MSNRILSMKIGEEKTDVPKANLRISRNNIEKKLTTISMIPVPPNR